MSCVPTYYEVNECRGDEGTRGLGGVSKQNEGVTFDRGLVKRDRVWSRDVLRGIGPCIGTFSVFRWSLGYPFVVPCLFFAWDDENLTLSCDSESRRRVFDH